MVGLYKLNNEILNTHKSPLIKSNYDSIDGERSAKSVHLLSGRDVR